MRRGLSLLELLIALGGLGVVLVAFLGLELTALKVGARGRALQAMVREGENFLEALRSTPQGVARCREGVRLGGWSGSCRATPCALDPGGALVCRPGLPSPLAYWVRLEVPRARPELRLETLIRP